jgi:hypothetical protein
MLVPGPTVNLRVAIVATKKKYYLENKLGRR